MANAGDAPTAKDMFFKTRLCKFFAAGKCDRGSRCTYAHGEEGKADLPDFYRTRLCPSFLRKGTCVNGTSCAYAHNKNELRSSVTKETSNAAHVSKQGPEIHAQFKMPAAVPDDNMAMQLQRQLLASIAKSREGEYAGNLLDSRSGVPNARSSRGQEQSNARNLVAEQQPDLQQMLGMLLEQQARMPPPPAERLLRSGTNSKRDEDLAAAMLAIGRNTASSASSRCSPEEVLAARLYSQEQNTQHLQQPHHYQQQHPYQQQQRQQHQQPRQPHQQQMTGMRSASAQQFDPLDLNLEQLEFLANVGARHLAELGVNFQNPASVEASQLFGRAQLPTQQQQPTQNPGPRAPHPSHQQANANDFGPQVGALLELRRKLQEGQGQRQQDFAEANPPSRSHGSNSSYASNSKGDATLPRQFHSRNQFDFDSSNIGARRQDQIPSNTHGVTAATDSKNALIVDSLVHSLQAVFHTEGMPHPPSGLTMVDMQAATQKHPATPSSNSYQGAARLDAISANLASGMGEAWNASNSRQAWKQHGGAHATSADAVAPLEQVAENTQSAPKFKPDLATTHGIVVKNGFIEVGTEDPKQVVTKSFQSQTLPNLPTIDDEDSGENLGRIFDSSAIPDGVQSLPGQNGDVSGHIHSSTQNNLPSIESVPSTTLPSSSAFPTGRVRDGPTGLTVKNTFLDVDDVNVSEFDFRNAAATAPELPLLFLDGEDESL